MPRARCKANGLHDKLGPVLVDLGKEQEAEELYLAVLSVEPEQLDAAYNLALLQDRRDEPDSIRRACAPPLYSGCQERPDEMGRMGESCGGE